MRTIGCCIIVLVLVLMCVGIASANPGGGVKSSPLFKASLTQSIAKLDGKVVRVARAGSEDEDMPTGGRICPNLPLTQQTTCEPSWCGGETCDVSCGGSCQSTCTETCVVGACVNFTISGMVFYTNNYGWDSSHGLSYPYYVNDRPVYFVWDDQQDYSYAGEFGVLCNYSFVSAHNGNSSGLSVFVKPVFLRSDNPNYYYEGYADAHKNGPLSYTQTNYMTDMHVYHD